MECAIFRKPADTRRNHWRSPDCTWLAVMSDLIGQQVSVEGGLRRCRKAVLGNPVDGDRMGKMAMVLLQEIPSLVVRSRNQSRRKAQLIDHQDDFNRRIGFGGNSIEGLPGDNLCWLAVVLQGKVLLSQASDWVAVFIRHHYIEPDYSLGWVGFNLRRWIGRGQSLLRE